MKKLLPHELLHYNMHLESALRVIFGKKYYGSAGLFQNPANIKKSLNDWIKKVEKRTYELTNYNERLRLTISLMLNGLKTELRKFPKEKNEWKIISYLINIINRLLGYDWDGEINSHVIYFQDAHQEHLNSRKRGDIKREDYFWCSENVRETQKKIVKNLKSQGLNNYKISQILNLSESTIRRFSKEE